MSLPRRGSFVLDASAVLAEAFGERGADAVHGAIPGGVVSTVNWSEVVQKSTSRGADVAPFLRRLQVSGLRLVPFSALHARTAAELWPTTRHFGISLADRACMALAIDLGLPILTADRRWTELDLPVAVESIR